jgi:hypothetical protein
MAAITQSQLHGRSPAAKTPVGLPYFLILGSFEKRGATSLHRVFNSNAVGCRKPQALVVSAMMMRLGDWVMEQLYLVLNWDCP